MYDAQYRGTPLGNGRDNSAVKEDKGRDFSFCVREAVEL